MDMYSWCVCPYVRLVRLEKYRDSSCSGIMLSEPCFQNCNAMFHIDSAVSSISLSTPVLLQALTRIILHFTWPCRCQQHIYAFELCTSILSICINGGTQCERMLANCLHDHYYSRADIKMKWMKSLCYFTCYRLAVQD